MIKALLDSGAADLTATNYQGCTPFQLARDLGHLEAAEVLREYASRGAKSGHGGSSGGGGSRGGTAGSPGNSGIRRSRQNGGRSYSSGSGPGGMSRQGRAQLAPEEGEAPSAAEMQRIMAVWERFFENAFAMHGISMTDDDNNDDDDLDHGSQTHQFSRHCEAKSTSTYDFSHDASISGGKSHGRPAHTSGDSKLSCEYGPSGHGEPAVIRSTMRGQQNHISNVVDSHYAPYAAPSSAVSKIKAKRYSSEIASKPYSVYEQSIVAEPATADSKVGYDESYDEGYCESSQKDYVLGDQAAEPPISYNSIPEQYVEKLISWFDWVVCWDPVTAAEQQQQEERNPGTAAAAAECYYVVNKHTQESAWLKHHMDRFRRESLLPCVDWDDFDFSMRLPLPVTLLETVCNGWLTFYDQTENACSWMNLPTNSVELYLPLGVEEESSVLEAFGFSREDTDPDSVWYKADGYCSTAWVLVVGASSAVAATSGSNSIVRGSESKGKGDRNDSLAADFIVDQDSRCATAASDHKGDGATTIGNGMRSSSMGGLGSSKRSRKVRDGDKEQYQEQEQEQEPWESSRTSYTGEAVEATSSKKLNREEIGDSGATAGSKDASSQSRSWPECHDAKGKYDDDAKATIAVEAAAVASHSCGVVEEAEEQQSEECCFYYYRNLVTGETCWDPPNGWDDLVERYWAGWTLCCDEADSDDMYWYEVLSLPLTPAEYSNPSRNCRILDYLICFK